MCDYKERDLEELIRNTKLNRRVCEKYFKRNNYDLEKTFQEIEKK